MASARGEAIALAAKNAIATVHTIKVLGMRRHRARELAELSGRERDEDRRRHLVDVAASYQRAADMMAPPLPSSGARKSPPRVSRRASSSVQDHFGLASPGRSFSRLARHWA